jgi:Co/Zn/Cd efflux system component
LALRRSTAWSKFELSRWFSLSEQLEAIPKLARSQYHHAGLPEGGDMAGCGCEATPAETAVQKRTRAVALSLNATMFVVGLVAGLVAQSSGLLADSLDMLVDATAYAIALIATRRSAAFKARAAGLSGGLLLVLGIGVLIDVGRRALSGSSPEGAIMVAVASVIASGLVVWLTGNRYVDLIVGGAIGTYVIKEAFEILVEAREASSTGVATRG